MTMSPDIQTLPAGVTEARGAVPSIGERGMSHGLLINEAQIEQVGQLDLVLEPEAVQPDTLGLAVHHQIQIGSLLDHRLRMSEPITLEMEQEGEFHLAKYDVLEEFGYGTDPISAVQDFRKTIAELYWQLKEDEERLGPDLAETWRRLSVLVYVV